MATEQWTDGVPAAIDIDEWVEDGFPISIVMACLLQCFRGPMTKASPFHRSGSSRDLDAELEQFNM